MSFFDELKGAINDGQEGRNKGWSLGMPRMDKHITLRKKMFYMIMGSTGSGKSSFLHDAFILNPLELTNKENTRSIKYTLFSMERSRAFILAKWLMRRMFLDSGILTPMNVLLNWYGDKLSDKALELIEGYEDYFDFLEKHIEIYEGSRSAADIFRIVKTDSEKYGKEQPINEYKNEYIPNDPSVDRVVVIDHFGLTKTTPTYPTKKQSIDRLSEHIQYFRDFLGMSVVAVNQLNRDLSSSSFAKLDSFEPHLDNAKESGTTIEAADVVLSIFDPLRYNTADRAYGDVTKFKSPLSGHKYFRNIKVLKNSYGADDIGIGTAFQGETGRFCEIKKASELRDMTPEAQKAYIESIFNNSLFLQ